MADNPVIAGGSSSSSPPSLKRQKTSHIPDSHDGADDKATGSDQSDGDSNIKVVIRIFIMPGVNVPFPMTESECPSGSPVFNMIYQSITEDKYADLHLVAYQLNSLQELKESICEPPEDCAEIKPDDTVSEHCRYVLVIPGTTEDYPVEPIDENPIIIIHPDKIFLGKKDKDRPNEYIKTSITNDPSNDSIKTVIDKVIAEKVKLMEADLKYLNRISHYGRPPLLSVLEPLYASASAPASSSSTISTAEPDTEPDTATSSSSASSSSASPSHSWNRTIHASAVLMVEVMESSEKNHEEMVFSRLKVAVEDGIPPELYPQYRKLMSNGTESQMQRNVGVVFKNSSGYTLRRYSNEADYFSPLFAMEVGGGNLGAVKLLEDRRRNHVWSLVAIKSMMNWDKTVTNVVYASGSGSIDGFSVTFMCVAKVDDSNGDSDNENAKVGWSATTFESAFTFDLRKLPDRVSAFYTLAAIGRVQRRDSFPDSVLRSLVISSHIRNKSLRSQSQGGADPKARGQSETRANNQGSTGKRKPEAVPEMRCAFGLRGVTQVDRGGGRILPSCNIPSAGESTSRSYGDDSGSIADASYFRGTARGTTVFVKVLPSANRDEIELERNVLDIIRAKETEEAVAAEEEEEEEGDDDNNNSRTEALQSSDDDVSSDEDHGRTKAPASSVGHRRSRPFQQRAIVPRVIAVEDLPRSAVGFAMSYHDDDSSYLSDVTAVGAVVMQVVWLLVWLHSWSILHGDIKPPHIRVSSSGKACLVDFGRAIMNILPPRSPSEHESEVSTPFSSIDSSDPPPKWYGHRGTAGYEAPEVVMAEGYYCAKSEVYAFGRTVSDLLDCCEVEVGSSSPLRKVVDDMVVEDEAARLDMGTAAQRLWEAFEGSV